jgi:thiol-disulfide isomerase/thioredoxin
MFNGGAATMQIVRPHRPIRLALGLTLSIVLLAQASILAGELSQPGPRPPEFPSGLTWLNSDPLKVEGLKGKVFMVDFWEYTCVNCIRTLPYLKAWHDRYADKGLTIIGVHTPEFAFAKDLESVRKGVKSFDLKYPIVNDADYKIWNSYGNRYWPAKFLFDSQGRLRYYHFGEGAYGDTEQVIQKLLREVKADVVLPAVMEPIRGEDKPGAVCHPVTPELYAGYLRGVIGNKEGFRKEEAATYKDPGDYQDGSLYLEGVWASGPEGLRHARATEQPSDYVALRYHAIEVNCVLKPEGGKPIRVIVTQDGKPVPSADRGADVRVGASGETYLEVDEPKMYRIIKNAAFGAHNLKLACAEPGLGIYAFTFVSCVAPERPAGAAPAPK